jgi:hypothetical protein
MYGGIGESPIGSRPVRVGCRWNRVGSVAPGCSGQPEPFLVGKYHDQADSADHECQPLDVIEVG